MVPIKCFCQVHYIYFHCDLDAFFAKRSCSWSRSCSAKSEFLSWTGGSRIAENMNATWGVARNKRHPTKGISPGKISLWIGIQCTSILPQYVTILQSASLALLVQIEGWKTIEAIRVGWILFSAILYTSWKQSGVGADPNQTAVYSRTFLLWPILTYPDLMQLTLIKLWQPNFARSDWTLQWNVSFD